MGQQRWAVDKARANLAAAAAVGERMNWEAVFPSFFPSHLPITTPKRLTLSFQLVAHPGAVGVYVCVRVCCFDMSDTITRNEN